MATTSDARPPRSGCASKAIRLAAARTADTSAPAGTRSNEAASEGVRGTCRPTTLGDADAGFGGGDRSKGGLGGGGPAKGGGGGGGLGGGGPAKGGGGGGGLGGGFGRSVSSS